MNMAKIQLVAAALVFAAPPAFAADYRENWQDGTMQVAIALKNGGAAGCGEFYQKPHKTMTNEWLVACTRDGRNFTAYQVWPNIEKVLRAPTALLDENGGPPRR